MAGYPRAGRPPAGLWSRVKSILTANVPALRHVSLFYDASRYRRRLSRWTPDDSTINQLLAKGGHMLRARARDVVRNNPYASSAASSFASNAVGTGIVPSSLIEDRAVRKQIQDLWTTWVEECDADENCDFYGMQEMVARALFESGECFVRFRPRRESDGLSVPLQLQLLESDMLPYNDARMAPPPEGATGGSVTTGNVIMNGIEFDVIGRRVAYWFFPYHPGELLITLPVDFRQQVRVPAEQVLHIFRAQRPGDIRGVPLVTPGLVKLWLLDQYDDAELDRKKTAAMFAGFITSPTPDEFASDAEAGETPNEGVVTLEPGTMQTLLPGEEITFSSPAEVGGGYEAFQYRQLLAIFSALGIPYSLGTSDLRRANYSSLRGAMVEFRRRITQVQWNVFVHRMCKPVWTRWMNDAVLSGALKLPGFVNDPRTFTAAKWHTPKFDWVDPLKDQQAEKLAVDAGFKSRGDVIEEMGEDVEETDARIKSDKDREKKLGLEFAAIKITPKGSDRSGGGRSGGGGGFPGGSVDPARFGGMRSPGEGERTVLPFRR